MNKVYKVIWSKVRNCYVVVSELAKRNGKNTGTTDKRRKVTGGLALAAMAVALNLGTVGMAEAAIAFGTNAKAEGASSIAVGDNAYATKDNNIAVGTYATVGTITQDDARTKAYYALQQTIKDRLNINVVRYATDYTSLIDALDLVISNPVYSDSRRTNASNYKTQLIDLFTVLQKRVDSTNSIAMGNAATAIGSFAIAVGDNAQATAQYAIATGYNARATAQDAIVVGNTAYANGISAIAIGSKARAGKRPISNYDTNIPIDYAIAVGHSAQATETSAVAVGYDARAYTPNSIAIGKSSGIGVNYSKEFDTTMEGGNSIAIGTNAKNFTYGFFQNETNYYANTKNAIAIGNQAHTHAPNAFAIGVSTDATADRSFAIGTSSTDAVSSHQGTRAGGQGALAFGDSAHVVRKQFINTKDHGAPENRATDTAVNDSFSVGTNTLIQSRNAVSLGGGMSYTYHVISEDGKTMTSKTLYYKKDSEDSGGWVPEALGTGANIGEASDGAVAIGGASATVTPKTDDKGTLIDNTYVNFPTKSPTESLEITDYTAAASIGDKATRAVAIGSGAKIGDNAVNSVAVGARNIVTGKNSTAVGAGHSKYLNSPSYSYSNSVSANESGVLGNNNMVGKQLFSNSDLGLNPDSSTGYVFVVGSDNEINTAKDNQDAYFINVFGTANKVESTVDGVWYSEASTIIGKGNEAKNLAASLVAGNGNGKQFNYPGYDIPLENILHSQIIGNLNTVTDVTDVVVLGNKNTVTGNGGSIAIGVGSTVYGSNAIAVGPGNIVTGLNSTAVGQGNQVAGIGSGAFGDPNMVAGDSSFAFGDNNKIGKQVIENGTLKPDSTTKHVFAVGDGNKIGTAGNATKINVFGSSNTIEGAAPSTNSSIIGNNNEVTDKLINSLVAGNSNTKLNQVDNSLIIGNSNKIGTNVSNMVVLGNNTTVTDVTSGIDSAIAIGEGTTVEASNAIATGAGAKASKFGSVALGFGSVANREAGKNASDSTSSGYDVITGEASASTTPVWRSNLAAVSVGADGKTTRQITNVAAGIEDTDAVNVAQLKRAAIETDNRNVGLITNADSKREITSPFIHVAGVEDAVKNERLAELQRQLVILENQKAALEFAGATADEIAAAESQIYDVKAAIDSLKNNINDAFAQAKGDFSIAIGKGARASAKSSVAIGEGAIASADNAFAAGWDSKASKENAVAIGSGSSASASGGVALGSSSVANREAGTSGWDVLTGNKSTDTSPIWRSTLAAVSVGADGQTRQITNVAAGSEDTDAVNVAQLKKAATHYYSVNADDFAAPDGTNYLNDGATGAGALATGRNSKASGENAVAVGSGSSATSAGSFAAGQDSKASGENAVAVGLGSSATSAGSFAFGQGSSASGENAVAIGSHSSASVSGSVALGSSSVANREAGRSGWDVSTGEVSTDTSSTWRSNLAAVSVGADGQTRQITNVAAGSEDTDAVNVAQLKKSTTHYYSVNADDSANPDGTNYLNDGATGAEALAAGPRAAASGDNAVAVGSGSSASGAGALATGQNSKASEENAVAIGSHSSASVSGGVALGSSSVANREAGTSGWDVLTGNKSTNTSPTWHSTLAAVSVGADGQTRQITNVAAGSEDTDAVNVAQLKKAATHYYSVNANDSATPDGTNYLNDGATGAEALAAGPRAAASGDNAVAVGSGSSASGAGALAAGLRAASVENAVAVGSESSASGAGALAAGRKSEASGKNAAAIGSESSASGAGSFAAGQNSKASSENAVAIGSGSSASASGGVALGSSSVASRSAEVAGYDIVTGTRSTQADPAWKSTLAAVSVGADGQTRQITNVAAGSEDTDAVNVAQLKRVSDTINDVSNTGLKFDANVGGVQTNKLGSTIEIKGDGTKDINSYSGKNIQTEIAQDSSGDTTIKVKLDENPVFNSVTAFNDGNHYTKMDSNGIHIANGLSIVNLSNNNGNLDVGWARITNVAPGTDPTDAVNVAQLNNSGWNIIDNIGNKKGTVLNGQNVSFKDGAGTVSTVDYDTMSGTASVSYSVDKAGNPNTLYGVVTGGTTNKYWDSEQTQNAINQSGFHITTSQSAGTAAYTTMHLVRNGETVTIDAGKNIAITQSETKISVATKDDVKFNTAEVTNVLTVGEGPGQVSISNDGIRTGDTILNTEGLTIMGGPSVTRAGIDAGERTITNVKAGTADTDAVNVSQLKEYAATSTELAKAARTEVKTGTNVSSVTEEKAADGHSVYTVNADGTSVSAGSAAVKVEKGVKDANNVTDYSIDLSDATKATLAKAETSGLTFKGDNGSTKQIKLGDTVNIAGDNNITTEAAADQMKIKLNKNIDLGNDGSLTTGNTKVDNNGLTTGDTTVSNTGLTITGGPSVTKNNVNMGGNRIQNVGAGTDDSDAVNYGQLKSELKNVASQISSVDSDNRAVTINKEDGKQVVSSPFLHINGVGSNVEEKDKAMANGMESIAIGRGATAEKHLAVAIGTGSEAAIHSSVALGDHSVTTAEDKAGIRTGKYGYDVVTNSQYKGVDRFSPTWQSTAGSVSVGGGVEPATKETVTRRISNVAAGIKDTDVVNVAQLKRAANYLTDHRSTSIGTNANGERVIVSPYLAMHGVEEAAQAKSLIDTYKDVKEYTGALQNDISTLKGEQTNLDRDVTNLTNQISDMDARLAAFNDKTTDEYKELAYERAILDEEKTTLSNELSEVTELLAEREGLLKTADADYEKAWELASDYAQADGEKSFAHGSGTRVTGKESMAQGSDSTVVGNQSIAIGTGQEVYGSNSGAIGDPNVLAAERSYVIGNLNTVGDKNDIQADSDTTKFDTNNVFVFGNDNTVESGKEHVYIFGSNVTKTEKNSVILGNESAVYAEANNRTAGTGVYKSETINGKTYNYAGGDKEVGVVSVGNADAPRRIQNVAPGKVSAESTDAINGSQLYAALDNVNHNVNQSLNDLGDQISNVDNRSKKGIAGAAALAALHPLDFDPDDKLSFAAGMGHYRGETAAALGMFYRPSEKVMLSLGGTMGNGENMVNAGISFSLDRTPRVTGSRTALTKEVVNLREQVAKQDAQIAKQDQQIAMQGAQIAQLTALVSQLTGNKVEIPVVPQVKAPAPFPDNLDNKWAYDRIEELEQQGYISGYAGRALSRNEFAAALDRALAGGATLDERLIKEFESELSHVRVSHVKGKGNEEGKSYERPRSKAHQYK